MPSFEKPNGKILRDKRSHDEKLSQLWKSFGELKEKANRENKVNLCSLSKVAVKAGVNKVYLTGNKKISEKGVAEKYRAVGTEILKFREQFQEHKKSDSKENYKKSIELELVEVKSSIYQYFMDLESTKVISETYKSKLKQAEETILLLQVKLSQYIDQVDNKNNSIKQFFNPSSRTIISPDKYMIFNGRYEREDEKIISAAWLRSYDELESAMLRPYAKRLYLLVGLPCSGKSSWARNAEIFTDRQSIIFDQENLDKFERESLIHRVKRFKEVKKCCVYFDISIEVIMKRIAENTVYDKKLTASELNNRIRQLKIPNPTEETWIDEMIVVRNNG